MVAYGPPPTPQYGGYSTPSYGEAEQNNWKQLAEGGVGVNYGISTLGQQNQLGGSTAQQQQSQQQGYDAMSLMRAQAMGGQTPAMAQAAATLQYGNNAQRAMASNAGSPQALAAARTQAANNTALQASNTANQQRALAAQEQQTGMQQYGNMANSMRGNAQNMYADQNNFNFANAQEEMQTRQANDQLALGYSGLNNAMQVGEDQIALGQTQENINNSQNNFNNAVKGLNIAGNIGSTGIAIGGGGNSGGGNSGGGSGGGGSGGGGLNNPDVQNSDERLKTDVQRTSLMRPFLDTLAGSRATYRYKNPSDEPRAIPTGGRYAGVMAQDLERVPDLGHQLVIDTPYGKKVDTKTSLSALMAGVGDIHDRVKRLEGYREYDDD
jgi:hypothetical protein